MPNSPQVLITAGGTLEPIDDVRFVGNSSTGRLGAAIANAMVGCGARVRVLGSSAMLAHPEWLDPRIGRRAFHAFADLHEALIDEVTTHPPDILLMAAAVADYSPLRQPGKLTSSDTEMVVTMHRNPKILDSLRSACSPETFLVGFKLLSHADESELIATARDQLMSAKLDLTIANDIATFRNDAHPVWAIDADDAEFIDGPRERVAQRLATTILTRAGHTLHPVDPRTHGLWFTDHDADTPTQEKWATVTRDILRGAKHAGHDPSRWRIEPILYSGQLIGGVGRRGQRAAPLILPEARNEGHGQRLINHLGEVGLELTTTAPYVDWFIARGYQIVSRNAHGARLRPPHGRSDLRTAASVCLFCSHTRQVLVGQRQRSPKSGWWALPGGHQEPAEDLATTAARELLEETGIDIPTGPPALQYSSFSGCDDGKTAWNITTHVHDVPTPIATRPSPELVAQWMTLDQALKLDPLTTGTRQVLLAVSEHWPALRSTDTS